MLRGICVLLFFLLVSKVLHTTTFCHNTRKTLFYFGAAVHTYTKSCHLSHKHCAPCEKFMYMKGRLFFLPRLWKYTLHVIKNVANIWHPHFIPVNLPHCLWPECLPTKSTLCVARLKQCPPVVRQLKGPLQSCSASHAFPLGQSEGLHANKGTHCSFEKKKKLFPPQSEECLSVVSTLPWKHMVRFCCCGCMRGELHEKSYDHRRPSGWLNMWVSGRSCTSIIWKNKERSGQQWLLND